MKKSTVDIIVTINSSLDWLKFCVDAIVRNTDLDLIGTIYLVADHDGTEMQSYLTQITKKWHGLISVVHGKTVKAIKLATSNRILLLNSNCILSENAIAKMCTAMDKDSKIGVLFPLSSAYSPYAYATPDGMNFMQVNEYLGNQFSGDTYTATSAPINCLMLTRSAITKVGLPDSSNYPIKAEDKGFSTKVLIDTYVYNRSPYSENDPINEPAEYVKKHVKYGKVKNACQLVVTDLVEFEKLAVLINNLIFDHINVEMVARPRIVRKYKGIMLFAPTIKRGLSFK